MAATIANPRPVPPLARASSARLNRSKACARNPGGKPGPCVEHVQLDVIAVAGGAKHDRLPAVAQRVVDEVAERLLEAHLVAVEHGAGWSFDLDPRAGLDTIGSNRSATRPSSSSTSTVVRSQREPALVSPGQHEEVLREPREALRLLGGGAKRTLELLGRPGPAQRELELGLEHGERRPQLVARIGDEAPLALDRSLEPSEHLVQRLAEPRDLVARGRQRETPPQLRPRDRRGLGTHRLDGPQRRCGEQVAAERDEEQHDRRHDEQLADERIQRLVAILE